LTFLQKYFSFFPGFVVLKKIFLTSKSSNSSSFFHKINEFEMIEEILPSFIEISSNIDIITCKCLLKEKKEFLGILSINNSDEYFSNSVKVPKFIRIINPKLFLLKCLTNAFNFKIIIKFGKRKGFTFNSIKKVNYIINRSDSYFNFVLFDITTKISFDPLESSIYCLSHINRQLEIL
jgi:hypothetical protein